MARRSAINLPVAAREQPAPAKAEQDTAPAAVSTRPAARQGKVQIAFFIDPDVKRMVGQIGLDEGKRIQRLMLEAVDLLLQSRNMGRAAVEGRITKGGY